MNDAENRPTRQPPGPKANTMPGKVVYGLYVLGFLVPFLTLGGVVYAYIARGQGEPLDSHLNFLIRTFWISLGVGLLGIALSFIGIGVLILIGLAVWAILRLITGFLLLNDGVPVTTTEYMGAVAK